MHRSLHRIAWSSAAPGQGLTEFALLLPVLLFVLLGAVDLGRVYNSFVTIANASREGARYGMTNPAKIDEIKIRTQQEASAAGLVLPSSAISVNCSSDGGSALDCAAASDGDRIRVQVQFDFQLISLYLFRLPTIPISNSTVMVIVGGASS